MSVGSIVENVFISSSESSHEQSGHDPEAHKTREPVFGRVTSHVIPVRAAQRNGVEKTTGHVAYLPVPDPSTCPT